MQLALAEEGSAVELDDDHKLLLRCVLPLLKSRNSGVVLAVASVYQYMGPGNSLEDGLIGRALVRTMRSHREIEFVMLSNIVSMAASNPGMFRKYIKDFYVAVRVVLHCDLPFTNLVALWRASGHGAAVHPQAEDGDPCAAGVW